MHMLWAYMDGLRLKYTFFLESANKLIKAVYI